MREVIHNSKAAISRTIVYYADGKFAIRDAIVHAVALGLAIAAFVTPKNAIGNLLAGAVALWAIRGLAASIRIVYQRFTNLD